MELIAGKQRVSIAEYLERERPSLDKHEFRDGEIIMMPGGTGIHSLITANTIAAVGSRLKESPCRVYKSNLRIRIPRKVLYTYPDITIICGSRETGPDDSMRETFTNSRLLIEVLSPSSESYDRGERFHRYLLLDSLQQYVLVSQRSPRIEAYFRQSDGTWLFENFAGLETKAKLRSIEIELPLAEVYAGVEFPAA